MAHAQLGGRPGCPAALQQRRRRRQLSSSTAGGGGGTAPAAAAATAAPGFLAPTLALCRRAAGRPLQPCLAPSAQARASSSRAASLLHDHRRAVRPCRAPAAAADAASSSGMQQPDQQQQQQQQQYEQQLQQQQQQQRMDEPPGGIELPPSRSAALWLPAVGDTELRQLAQDWGYERVGRPLPEGLSLNAVADTLPDECFRLSLPRALGSLALSLALMAAGYAHLWYWHSICPLWQQLACWLVVGTGYFGAFQTAVDCAHFAFWPRRPLVQDVLGAALMAPALFSYEVFRLKYLNHLMCTNQLYEDTDAWHPLLPADIGDLPPWRRALLRLLAATPLKFFSSIGQWARSCEGFDLKLHPAETRRWVWLSWALPLAFAGVVWPALVAAGGIGWWATCWLGPWVVFHGWLSTLSLVQHTAPHIPWAEEGLEYDRAQAVINGTVTLRLPAWLEALLHNANYHLAAHVSISVPSYNLRAAHEYLEARLGPYMTTARLNAQLLRNLVTAWVVYDERRQRYVDLDEAEELLQPAPGQRGAARRQEAGPAAEAGGGGGGSQPAASGGNGAHGGGGGGGGEREQQRPQPSGSPAAAFGGA